MVPRNTHSFKYRIDTQLFEFCSFSFFLPHTRTRDNYILHEAISNPCAVRAMEVSHAACKHEFSTKSSISQLFFLPHLLNIIR